MSAPDDGVDRPYIHLQPPMALPGGGVQVRFRSSDGQVHTLTVPKRRASADKIHEAVMATINSRRRPPLVP